MRWNAALTLALLGLTAAPAAAQGPPGMGGPGGFGGPGGMMARLPLMTALDTDKNGEISGKEITAAPKTLKKLDKNKDGKIAGDELRPNFRGRGGPGGRPGGGPGGFGGPGGGGPGGYGGPGGAPGRGGPGGGGPGRRRSGFMARLPLMMALDTDKNGDISAKEIAASAAGLKKIDKNKNGRLEPEELRPNFGGPGGGRPPAPRA